MVYLNLSVSRAVYLQGFFYTQISVSHLRGYTLELIVDNILYHLHKSLSNASDPSFF